MKRLRQLAISMACMVALGFLCSCTDKEDARKKELIQSQINIIERQVVQINVSRAKIQSRLRDMEDSLQVMSEDLDKCGARITSAKASNLYLRELTTVGLGEAPGLWVLRNPAFTTNIFLGLAFGLLSIWLLWRLRQGQLERGLNSQINQVIERLSPDPSAAEKKTVKTAALPHKTAPPQPEAKKKTAPQEPAAISSEAKKPKPEEPKKIEPPADKAAKKEKTAAKKPAKEAGDQTPAKTEAPKAGPTKRKTDRKKETRKKVVRRLPAKKCKVEGCKNKHRSKGFCNKHYQQWRRDTLEEEIVEN